jgi:hypothetical protein
MGAEKYALCLSKHLQIRQAERGLQLVFAPSSGVRPISETSDLCISRRTFLRSGLLISGHRVLLNIGFLGESCNALFFRAFLVSLGISLQLIVSTTEVLKEPKLMESPFRLLAVNG